MKFVYSRPMHTCKLSFRNGLKMSNAYPSIVTVSTNTTILPSMPKANTKRDKKGKPCYKLTFGCSVLLQINPTKHFGTKRILVGFSVYSVSDEKEVSNDEKMVPLWMMKLFYLQRQALCYG